MFRRVSLPGIGCSIIVEKKEKGSGMYSCVVAKQEYTSIKNTGEFYLSK